MYKIGAKELSCNIVQVEFIPSEESIQMVSLDEFDDVALHSIKKKLLRSAKWELSPLQVGF